MRRLLHLAALTMAAVAVAAAPALADVAVLGGGPGDDIPDFVFEEDGVFGEGGSVVIDGDVVYDCRSFAGEFAGGGVPYADADSDLKQARRVLEQCEEAGLPPSEDATSSASPSASASASPVAEEAPVATTPEPAATTTLPETGGPSGAALLLLPAAGLLLAAGLVGLRAARRRS